MASLNSILDMSAASLDAERAAMATASQNLQNAGTPGYSRQVAVLAATEPAQQQGQAFIGSGVTLQTVTQVRDQFLENQIPAQLGNAAGSAAGSSALQSVSALDPQATGGVASSLSAFYASLQTMEQNPADPGIRQSVVAAAQALAQSFQSTRSALEGARTGADAKLQGDVSQVNGLAAQVASLNGQIATARASGGQPNDLLDARQSAMDQLASLAGVAPVTDSSGNVSLFLPGGAPLVAGLQSFTLSTAPDPANGGHLALQLQGPSGSAVALTGVGGEMGGIVSARDGALATAETSLDGLAWDLGTSVNAVHQAGYGLDGSTGNALFTLGASSAGAAGQISVNAAIATDPAKLAAAGAATGPTSAAPGDTANLQALVATQQAMLPSSGQTATATIAQITSSFGSATQTATALSSQDAAILSQLQTMRSSVSGVSIDQELVSLQQAQRGYQAISQVIQTAGLMFDSLLTAVQGA